GAVRATDARSLQAPSGFQVELVRSAGADEGSWIALAFDSKGRLLVSREDKGIWRMTLPAPNANGELDPAAVRTELVNDTLLECRGLLWAHDSLYANANNSKALYRLRDLDGDDKFEKVELLKATAAHVGHGRNDLALGPDGMIYSIHGDDVRLPADYDPKGSPLRNYLDARLLDCKWDETLFNASMELPGGYVARTDRDGKKWEVVAGGLRNPYGLDFNSDGELFTYDADMEWDVGMPWYRPTRVLHLASGADFGWRRGTGAWPAWYPDGWPSTHDVGLGSPTAVKFGTRTKFPPEYQRALFILDWSYGRIIAVHLQPNGASYSAREETFVLGRPLNVTDLEVGPDGAMYFTTGGRRTQSGLYRIRYVGPQAASPAPVSPAPAPAGAKQGAPSVGKQAETEQRAAESQKTKTPEESRKLRSLRKSLEALHGRVDPKTLDVAGPFLAHEDPWIRNAARVAIEHQPVESWTKQALEETTPWADVTGLLALARLAPAETRPKLLDRALSLDTRRMASGQQVTLLRAIAIALARHGRPSEAETRRLTDWAESRFPSTDPLVNMQLSELLVYLESTQVVSKTLPLLTTAKTQEEKVHYLMVLRKVRQPWTAAQRKLYFEWLRQAEQFYGAQYLVKFVQHIRDDAVATLSDSERTALAALIAPKTPDSAGAASGAGTGATGTGATSIADALKSRPFVRDWKLDDLIGALDDTVRKPDTSRGRAAYEAAQCHRCHRFGATGSPVGPDLTQVGRRFGRRDLLISILYPSHVIDEKYRVVSITTQDGRVLTGQVTASTDKAVTLLPDLLQPEKAVTIEKSQIETTTPVLVSPMPS
ncbi:MAG TPA: hypothetical protein PLV92_14505, partial [Pirellulaceae bacterium]|nr:hypothetical protein [Pirellulaceae bacterium]